MAKTTPRSVRDAEVRFRLMASRGKVERGLAILDRLDAIDAQARGQPRKTPKKASRRKRS
jgi:hypothetical protein